MIIVKLIVLICFIDNFNSSPTDYCEICLNHTLCKYKVLGPSPTCKSYDSSALLTSQDIIALVNKINERRNFVALGHSTFLPRAANMKKIHWSTDLATIAQRWADQCDSSVRPDKEDQCRDLENIDAGQNIASVTGPSTGLNVRSFVEMWFIQILDYTGSVTYYNESRDHKTRYFTQLIWADAEFVGCGKATFYVDERNSRLERLVCNFAPKGNIHGAPIYSIGYPGTQFPFVQLVTDKNITKQKVPVNSLLRILNLSNDLVKQEIDPIHSGLNKKNAKSNANNTQRNQKARHIFSNKSYTAVKLLPQLRKQMFRKKHINISENDKVYHYSHDRGHSHLYHGHEPPLYNYDITTGFYSNQDFRRYDYTTEPMNLYSNNNYRKKYQSVQCTRRMRPEQNNCAFHSCSRNPADCCQQTTICPSTCTEIECSTPVEESKIHPTPCLHPIPDPCTCTKKTCPPLTHYNYNTKCQPYITCPANTENCHTSICPGILRRNNGFKEIKETDTFDYYDIIPDVVVRSGNHKIPQFEKESTSQKSLPSLYNFDIIKYSTTISKGKDSEQKLYSAPDYLKYDYIYQSFDSSLREKRELDDQVTLTPFWQMENVNYKKRPSQLRNIKYTTLSNKNNRKSRKYSDITEPITLKLSDYEYQPEHVTEKYLSFDELMHLRKINDEYSLYDIRRKGKASVAPATKATAKKANNNNNNKTTKKPAMVATKKPALKATTKPATKPTNKPTNKPTAKVTTKATTNTIITTTKTTTKATTKITTTTTEYTANTPFERKKYCTRKLTCSWTAFSIDNEGKKVVQGFDAGSRTPHGYVEGCTRTSTCTRDYMDRNKMSTLPDPMVSNSTAEEGDYCERRSLNIQRRNSDEKQRTDLVIDYQDYSLIKVDTSTSNNPIKNDFKTHVCICNER